MASPLHDKMRGLPLKSVPAFLVHPCRGGGKEQISVMRYKQTIHTRDVQPIHDGRPLSHLTFGFEDLSRFGHREKTLMVKIAFPQIFTRKPHQADQEPPLIISLGKFFLIGAPALPAIACLLQDGARKHGPRGSKSHTKHDMTRIMWINRQPVFGLPVFPKT